MNCFTMKTIEICKVTGSLYCMASFMPLNMTEMQRLYHTAYIHRISHLSIFFYVFEDDCNVQRLYPIGDIHRVSLVCLLLLTWRLLWVAKRFAYIHRVSIQCILVQVLQNDCFIQRLYRINYIQRISFMDLKMIVM